MGRIDTNTNDAFAWLRRLHISILAVSAALLVLAVSADEARQYRDALSELRLIRRIPLNDLDGSSSTWEQWSPGIVAAQELAAGAEELAALDSTREGSRAGKVIRAALSSAGTFTRVDDHAWLDSARRAITSADSLAAVRAIFERDLPLQFVYAARTAVDSFLKNEMSDYDGCAFCSLPTIQFIYLPITGSVGIRIRTSAPEEHRVNTMDDTLRAAAEVHPGGELMHDVTALEILPSALKGRIEGADIVFPKLTTVWQEVSTLSVGGAERHLAQRILEVRHTTDLLGLKIDEALATLGGPILLSGLLLYLVLFGQHIVANASASSVRHGSANNIWSYSVPGSLARLAVCVELFVAPMLGSIPLIYRTRFDVSVHTRLVACTLVACNALLGIAAVRIHDKIRRLSAETADHAPVPFEQAPPNNPREASDDSP